MMILSQVVCMHVMMVVFSTHYSGSDLSECRESAESIEGWFCNDKCVSQ